MREIKKFGERSASQNKVRLSKYILIKEGEKTEPLYFDAVNNNKEKIKYIIKCESCGALIFREKRSKVVTHTNRYRCKCGGKLVIM